MLIGVATAGFQIYYWLQQVSKYITGYAKLWQLIKKNKTTVLLQTIKCNFVVIFAKVLK